MRNVVGVRGDTFARFERFARFDSFVTQKNTTLSLWSKNTR